jgi:hypothetical protein
MMLRLHKAWSRSASANRFCWSTDFSSSLPFDGQAAGIIGHAAVDFTRLDNQEGHVGENVVYLAQATGDDETHFVLPHPVAGAPTLQGNRRLQRVVFKRVLFGEDNAIALFDAFGQIGR